jgi:hypothetical protein
MPIKDLEKDALASRPELKASAATVSAADEQRLAARYGPLLVRIASSEILLLRVVASREMSPLLPSTGGHDGHAAHPCSTD